MKLEAVHQAVLRSLLLYDYTHAWHWGKTLWPLRICLTAATDREFLIVIKVLCLFSVYQHSYWLWPNEAISQQNMSTLTWSRGCSSYSSRWCKRLVKNLKAVLTKIPQPADVVSSRYLNRVSPTNKIMMVMKTKVQTCNCEHDLHMFQQVQPLIRFISLLAESMHTDTLEVEAKNPCCRRTLDSAVRKRLLLSCLISLIWDLLLIYLWILLLAPSTFELSDGGDKCL